MRPVLSDGSKDAVPPSQPFATGGGPAPAAAPPAAPHLSDGLEQRAKAPLHLLPVLLRQLVCA